MMEPYYQVDLSSSDGRTWYVEDEDEARHDILKIYPMAIFNDEWTVAGYTGYGNKIEQRIFWENIKEAGKQGTGDNGSNSIGSILKIERDDNDNNENEVN